MAPHRPIKILAVSDFVDSTLKDKITDKTLEPPDLIISCGDLPPEYLSFLRDRLDRPLFYVKGNHDIRYTEKNLMGCRNIHARIVKYNCLKILGLEGSMWYNGGQNQYTDKQIGRIIMGTWFPMLINKGIDIVVTHAPPRHIHDAQDRCHMGFDSFVKLIKKRNPGCLIHGHIHKLFENNDDRTTIVGRTRVINACGHTMIEV